MSGQVKKIHKTNAEGITYVDVAADPECRICRGSGTEANTVTTDPFPMTEFLTCDCIFDVVLNSDELKRQFEGNDLDDLLGKEVQVTICE